MKRTLTILFLCLAVAITAFAQGGQDKKPADTKPTDTKATDALPTVDQINEKYVQAIGGKAAIEKLKSRTLKGTIDIPAMGIKGTTESYAKAPNKSANRSSIDGIGDFMQGYDGTTAWEQNPMAGFRVLGGAELALVKRDAEFYGDLKFKELYPKAVVKGRQKLGDRDVYLVEATPAEGGVEQLYYDVQTGLLARRDFVLDSPQGQMPTETYLEDYKEVDGIKIPFTIRQTNPAVAFTIKVLEVKHNVPVDDAKFNKPASQ
ncbi:MAG TPA: hypothetical protein VLR90_03235 [Blastocatellia bacterium]|nr:hypothetical protein [Blastocatellia bacterium]